MVDAVGDARRHAGFDIAIAEQHPEPFRRWVSVSPVERQSQPLLSMVLR